MRRIVARTCFSKARCHLRCGKLPRALGFRRPNVIYGLQNCSAHLHFERSMQFMMRKIAARGYFPKARCHLRSEKIVARTWFLKAQCLLCSSKSPPHFFSEPRCHLRCVKLPHAIDSRRLNVIYGLENCRAYLLFDGSMP